MRSYQTTQTSGTRSTESYSNYAQRPIANLVKSGVVRANPSESNTSVQIIFACKSLINNDIQN